MIGVIIPSRGLIFSKTAEDIIKNLAGMNYKLYFSHRKPIPDCFEIPTQQALADDCEYLWFVEDDMILPPNTLSSMLAKGLAVVTYDYPVNDKGRGAVLTIKGETLITGTGCLLVHRDVFKELKPPYFRTDIKWTPKNYGAYIKFVGRKIEDNDGYGLHDVNFSINLYRRGIPIHVMPGTLGQRKLVKLGEPHTNNGAHQTEEWTKVKPNYMLNQIKQWPVQKSGNLVTVITKTGEVLVSPSHAKKLVKEGLATIPPRRPVVIDDSEVL